MISVYELGILDAIQNSLRNPLFDVLMPLITYTGSAGIIWIILGIVLLGKGKTWKERQKGWLILIALLFSLLLCNILLKNLVGRIRPFELNPEVLLIAIAPTDTSFPSGHTSSSFAAAVAMSAENRKLKIFAVIYACLIAFSRLYLYFHFPTDVLAGAVLGIICGLLSRLVIRRIDRMMLK